LRCFVVLELKAVEFEPEHTGKLNFYLSAVDEHLRHEQDNPTIGLLLCKTNNRVIAEYALRDVNKPIGVAEYQLVHALPAQLEANLPSIERLQAELTEADLDELETLHHGAGRDATATPPIAKPRRASAAKRRATRTVKASASKTVPPLKQSRPSKKAGR
jgi:hypothetical protein